MAEMPKEPPVSDSQLRRTRKTMMLKPRRDHGQVVVLHLQGREPEHQPPDERDGHATARPTSKGTPRAPRIATAYDPSP
jgi:hypothetical protein